MTVYAYIANNDSSNVSVINTETNTVTTTIPLTSAKPYGVAVTPDGNRVYIGNNSGEQPNE